MKSFITFDVCMACPVYGNLSSTDSIAVSLGLSVRV